MNRKFLKRSFLTVVFTLTSMIVMAQASVVERNEVIGTYDFGDPNPVAEPEALIYPYFRFDGYSHKAVSKSWRVVELENQYISVSVLPAAGGKIWGAINKKNGKEFIYKNNVMKFRNIAMRGPWASGGIEFNFGLIGHIPSTATPVDYVTKQNDDGSASCWVSSYEWATHTWWQVEIRVPADKAFFITRTTYHNSSRTDEPYYHWMNAAYHAYDDAVFAYPGNGYIGHDGKWHSFPIDEDGNNIGTMAGCDSLPSISMHVVGQYNDYNGIYYPKHGYGSLRFSPFADKVGQKIFLWGKARSGAIWEDLLTDGHGQYVELQSGRFYNQPSNGSERTPYQKPAIEPLATDTWTELWFPVMDIGGIVKASPAATLNVIRRDGRLVIALSPQQRLDTSLRVISKGKVIATLYIKTNALTVWSDSIPLTKDIEKKGSVTIELGDGLLKYSESPSDNIDTRPVEAPSDFDWSTAYGQFILGRNAINEKRWDEAEEHLRKSLSKEHYLQPALVAMANLYIRRGMPTEALSYARKALSVDTYDGYANYLFGLASRDLGHNTDAKAAFSISSRSIETRTAAYTALAEMYCRDLDWLNALKFVRRAITSATDNLTALRLMTTILRLSGKTDEAVRLADSVVNANPLYHPMRLEQALLGSISITQLKANVRCELPDQIWMELASDYERIGDKTDAIKVLALGDSNPIANYRRAWLLDSSGKNAEANALVAMADVQSPELIFPCRTEALPALKWAEGKTRSWKPRYYHALIMWSELQRDSARAILQTISEADYAPFYLTRAQLLNNKAKLADLKKAERIDPTWRAGLALTDYYLGENMYSDAETTARRYLDRQPDNYIIGLKLAKILCKQGKYAQCAKTIKALNVLPLEGSSEGQVVYKTAHIGLAIEQMRQGHWRQAEREAMASYNYPENLGVGRPYNRHNDLRLNDFIMARIKDGLGDKDASRKLYQQVIAKKPSSEWFCSADLLNALAMKALKLENEANAMAKTWTASYPNSITARWATAIYNGDLISAANIASEYRPQKIGASWEGLHQDNDFEIIQLLFK